MCGIAAFLGSNAPSYVYRLLLELQHRGQESAGISYVNEDSISTIVRSGYVLSAIDFSEVRRLNSVAAIGHVRYSTSGGYMGGEGAQPVSVGEGRTAISVAFNGNIMNYHELSKEYLKRTYRSDTEVLAMLIYEFSKDLGDVVEAVKRLSELVAGSYSLTVLTSESTIVIARDPHGFKPLAYSFIDDFFIAASETSAIESLGLNVWREVEAGEVVVCDGKSLELFKVYSSAEFTPCIFEYIYFSRPDSVFNGVQVHEARVRMGEYLGKLDDVSIDIVIPVPDSGRSAALGYSMAKGVRLDEGLFRNRYVGRSFIMPPKIREFISSVKYGVVRSVINGKNIAVVDDSLIRGITIKDVVNLLRVRGSKEVHVRIASPPIKYPCFMGVDFPSSRELIASRLGDVAKIAKAVGADSLLYNSVDGLKWATGLASPCLACFTGAYPFKGVDVGYLESIFTRW